MSGLQQVTIYALIDPRLVARLGDLQPEGWATAFVGGPLHRRYD